jgi:membrane-bound ClpP family serine protease
MSGEVRQIVAAPRSRFRPRTTARLLLAAIGTGWLLVAPAVHGAGKTVEHFTATGVVDNVMAGYLVDGIAGAEKDGAAAVVIELDTPGGSLDAMNKIVTA